MKYPLKNGEIEVLNLWTGMGVLYLWKNPQSQDVRFHVGVHQNCGPKRPQRKPVFLCQL